MPEVIQNENDMNVFPEFSFSPDGDILNVFLSNANFRTIERDGITWFVAHDLALFFGYNDATHFVRTLIPDAAEDATIVSLHQVERSNNRHYPMLCVSERGLDLLCMRLQRPEIKAFRDRVLDIIYSVRHKGVYMTQEMNKLLADSAAIEGNNVGARMARDWWDWSQANLNLNMQPTLDVLNRYNQQQTTDYIKFVKENKELKDELRDKYYPYVFIAYGYLLLSLF